MLGRYVVLPIYLIFHPGEEEDRGTPDTYAARHLEAMRSGHCVPRQTLQQSQRWKNYLRG